MVKIGFVKNQYGEGKMNEIDVLIKLWPFLVAFFMGAIWFIRLETKFNAMEKDYEKHKESIKEKDAAMWAKFDSIIMNLHQLSQSITRIETKLDMQHKEER